LAVETGIILDMFMASGEWLYRHITPVGLLEIKSYHLVTVATHA